MIFALIGYISALAFFFIRLFYGGDDIRAAMPILLITEPWSSLIGILYVSCFGGYMTDEYWDKLSASGIAIVMVSGSINAGILWSLSRLFRKSD